MRAPGSASPNRLKGYQCRITVKAASGASFPLPIDIKHELSTFATLPVTALNMPSGWAELDPLLQGQEQQVPILISASPVPLTSVTVQFDLADSSGRILKSVVETAQSNSVGFLIPGYGMSVTALTGEVTGLETSVSAALTTLRLRHLTK